MTCFNTSSPILSHTMLTSLLWLHVVSTSLVGAYVTMLPNSAPICNGQSDTGPGGMFGYSLAMTSDTSLNITWLAVGKPWDSTVHVYATKNPNIEEVIANLSGRAAETGFGSTTQTYGQFNKPDWQPISMLQDTGNGTFPNKMLSLFGYSVAFTEDGAWLAVGIPARTYQQFTTVQLQFSPYNGAVRIYRRQDPANGTATITSSYKYMGEIPNPNSYRFWDRFGSKVVLKKVGSRTVLAVSANSGWDGATVDYFNAPLASDQWPLAPTTDVSRAGVYVYHLQDYTRLSPPSNMNDLFAFKQFIPQKSQVPMGSLGIDFDVLDLGDGSMSILMRDYIFPSDISDFQVQLACPHMNCSYLVLNVNGKEMTVNSTGAVLEYRMSPDSEMFMSTGLVMESLTFPVSTSDAGLLNDGYARNSWEKNDWFGVGITAKKDPKYDRFVSVVGAPRDASGVFAFQQSSGNWNPAQFVVNQDKWRRSFFGQKVVLSESAQFLLVAEAAGTSESFGQGRVYLYHRRSELEFLFPDDVNAVPVDAVSSDASLHFDFIGTLFKSTSNRTVYESDHFGHGLASNKFFAIVGAPAESCVYSFAMPLAIDIPPTPVKPPTNYTIVPPPPTEAPIDSAPNSSNVWIYGMAAGILAVLLILPAVMYFLWHRHRQQVLSELKQRNGQNIATESVENIDGTRENLAEGEVLLSTTTLNS